MNTMPRGILSYFHVDFLKFGCNNYDFVKILYFVVSNIIIHADAEMRQALEAPQVQTDVDKNGFFRIRRTTQTDGREQFRRSICVGPLEIPLQNLHLF
jgi:hypothetical protein